MGASLGVLCVGFDRRSGATVESVEDIDGTLAPDELHPVLSWRLLEAGVRPPAHEHAPVQAVNALLQARGSQTGAEALADFSVTTVALDEDSTPVAMCASCAAVLHPVTDTHATTAPSQSSTPDASAAHASAGRRGPDRTGSDAEAAPEWIRDNVASTLRHLGPQVPFQLGFDRRSVEWVQGYLERARTTPDFDAARLVPALGSFLGQCLVETYRGTWVESNQEWAVRIQAADGLGSSDAFPFSKTHKQARDGLAGGESILSFFDLVADLPVRSQDAGHGGADSVGSGAAGPGHPAAVLDARGPAAFGGQAPWQGSELRDELRGEVRGEVRLDRATLRVMVRASLGWRAWLARAVGVLLLAWGGWLLIFGSNGAGMSSAVAVVVAVVFLGHDEVQTRLGWRQLEGLTDRPWRYCMHEAGFVVRTPASEVEVRWEMIRRVARTPRAWVLVMTTRGRIAIPRAAFTTTDAEHIDRRVAALSNA